MVRLGRPERRHITVLCVASSPKALAEMRRILSHSEIRILAAASRDQAVALCVSYSVAVALIVGEYIRGQQLSLAEALKIVRPSLPVILLEERRHPGTDLPENVDAIVQTAEDLLKKMDEMLNQLRAR
jgi:response regulator RpfG family c-di-GMP phosphodiesterase